MSGPTAEDHAVGATLARVDTHEPRVRLVGSGAAHGPTAKRTCTRSLTFARRRSPVFCSLLG